MKIDGWLTSDLLNWKIDDEKKIIKLVKIIKFKQTRNHNFKVI